MTRKHIIRDFYTCFPNAATDTVDRLVAADWLDEHDLPIEAAAVRRGDLPQPIPEEDGKQTVWATPFAADDRLGGYIWSSGWCSDRFYADGGGHTSGSTCGTGSSIGEDRYNLDHCSFKFTERGSSWDHSTNFYNNYASEGSHS